MSNVHDMMEYREIVIQGIIAHAVKKMVVVQAWAHTVQVLTD